VTALSGACPRFAPAANLLPAEYRRFNSRAVFVPTMVLAALLLLVAGSMAVYASWSEKQYLKQIDAGSLGWNRCTNAPISWTRNTCAPRAGPNCSTSSASRPAGIRRPERVDASAGAAGLEQQHRPGARLRAHRRRSAATAPLLKILDASPFFEKTEIQMSSPRASGESFQIRTNRRPGK